MVKKSVTYWPCSVCGRVTKHAAEYYPDRSGRPTSVMKLGFEVVEHVRYCTHDHPDRRGSTIRTYEIDEYDLGKLEQELKVLRASKNT